MAMKHDRKMRGATCLASVVCLAFFAGTAHSAVYWKGNDRNNFYVNEKDNWSGSVWNQALCIVNVQPTQRLTLKPGYSTFFGGAELDYSGAFAVTNDFGAGNTLVDVGPQKTLGHSMRITDGAQLVHLSGGIEANAAGDYKGTYIQDDSSFTIDSSDSSFSQIKGSVWLSANSGDATVYPKLFVQNGASLTVNTALIVGGGGNNVSACACVTGAGSRLSASVFIIGDNGNSPAVPRVNTLRIADSATATASTVNVGNNSSHAVLEVNGGELTASGKISVGASGNEATSNCVVRVVDGTLNYGTMYLYCDGNELAFTNATVSGTRIEMTRSSSIHLFNTHLTIPSGIFMMGDASGEDPVNNALKRDIYVGGTDTWVKVSASKGFWFRGSNTTIRVHIPAEGFSTSHPVFDLNKIVYGSAEHRIRIEVTADRPTEEASGTWYTFFRCSGDDSCRSDQIEWVTHDTEQAVVKIDKSEEKEVRIRVSRKRGLMIILK